MSVTEDQAVLYKDRWITCTRRGLVIGGYYFPFGFRKRIPYEEIRGVELVQMGVFSGKGRIWGTSHLGYWAHLDPRRPRKNAGLIIDVGRFVKPFITPDNPEEVKQILEGHMRRDPQGSA